MNFLLQHIKKLIDDYELSVPLSIYLKQYFKENPKLGSRDRKSISHALFLYYRFAKRLPASLSIFEVIFNGLHHAKAENSFLEKQLLNFDPHLPEKIVSPADLTREDLPQLSDGITADEWGASFFRQPDLFIRVRQNDVYALLTNNQLPHTILEKNGVALPNNVNLAPILPAESYVVQDWASQESVHFLLSFIANDGITNLWDSCAGAGGKSLLITDLLPTVSITATDIRPRILHNLSVRFQLYKLPLPEILTLDASNVRQVKHHFSNRSFDLILCDVPCSGSGTWARTPEQYHFFQASNLKSLLSKQFQIVSNTLPYLKEGGLLAYVTCSVFREENEDLVEKVSQKYGLKKIATRLINGTSVNSDSLFIAILKK